MALYNEYLNAIIQSISTLCSAMIEKAPFDKTYSGIITAINSDGTYSTRVNGRVYNLKVYTPKTLKVNQSVLVLFPQNNTSNAIIL